MKSCCVNFTKVVLICCLISIALSGCTEYYEAVPVNILCERGFDAIEKGDSKSASKWFQLAIEKDPANVESYVGMGLLAEAEWDFSSAIANYETAVKYADKSQWSKIQNTYLRIADLYAVTGSIEDGKAVLLEAYRETGDSTFLDVVLDEKKLVLSGMCVTDISPLAEEQWANLECLELWTPNVSDYSAIGALAQLKKLTMVNCEIAQLSFLKDLYQLEYLDLSENKITNINPLTNLHKVHTLKLSYNSNLQSISGIEYMTGLKHLYINNTKVTSLEPLNNSSQLITLDISWLEEISNFEPLENCPITMLFAYGLQLDDIQEIKKMCPRAVIYT